MNENERPLIVGSLMHRSFLRRYGRQRYFWMKRRAFPEGLGFFTYEPPLYRLGKWLAANLVSIAAVFIAALAYFK